MIHLLLRNKSNTPVGGGKTLLHLAVENENIGRVKQLLHLGISVTTQDNERNSPLHIATMKENKELFRSLITQENVNLINRNGVTAGIIAKRSANEDFKRFALTQIKIMTPSH